MTVRLPLADPSQIRTIMAKADNGAIMAADMIGESDHAGRRVT